MKRDNTDKDEDRTNDHHATQAVKDLANSVDHVADEASFSVSFGHFIKFIQCRILPLVSGFSKLKLVEVGDKVENSTESRHSRMPGIPAVYMKKKTEKVLKYGSRLILPKRAYRGFPEGEGPTKYTKSRSESLVGDFRLGL